MSEQEYLSGRPHGLRRSAGPLESLLNFAYRAWCSVSDGLPHSQEPRSSSVNGAGRISAANDDTYEPRR